MDKSESTFPSTQAPSFSSAGACDLQATARRISTPLSENNPTVPGLVSNTQAKRDPVGSKETGKGHGQESSLSRDSGTGVDLIYMKEVPWTQDKEKILLGPFDYMFGNPGKDIRSQLIAAFNAWLKVPDESLGIITKVVGMLHTASLL